MRTKSNIEGNLGDRAGAAARHHEAEKVKANRGSPGSAAAGGRTPCARGGAREGEPWILAEVVGADGFEPPTYAL